MPDYHYWDEVLDSFLKQPGRELWRDCCDSIYSDLIRAWLGTERVWGKVLKTDLFDEAVNEGLFPQLSQIASEVHGVDLAPEVVDAAKARHPHLQVECGDARSLPYADGTFDLVVSNSTLDHFEYRDDLVKAFEELYRVLKPGGALLVTLDNLDNPVIAMRRALPRKLLKKMGLVPFYPGITLNSSGMCKALKSSGFAIDSRRTIMHAPRVVAVKLAALIEKGPVWLNDIFKRVVTGLECLEHWPFTRFSGYYVAALAVKAEPSQGVFKK